MALTLKDIYEQWKHRPDNTVTETAPTATDYILLYTADGLIKMTTVSNLLNNPDGALTIGEDDTGYDVKFFGATSGAYMLWDESADGLLLAGNARIDLSSCTVNATNTDGGVLKCGTSVAPVTEDTANMKFMSMYFDNGATSGDNRGMYLRLYLTGAGGGGESFRAFTSVTDVAAATAHGAHISLSLGATGSCTGQGTGVRATCHIPDVAMTGGTYSAGLSEFYADGSSSDISGTTLHAIHRFISAGDNTGKATVQNVFSFEGLGSTALANAGTGANSAGAAGGGVAAKVIKVKVDGTDYWMPLFSSNAS